MRKRDTVYLKSEEKEVAWNDFITAWQQVGGPQPLELEEIAITEARSRVLAEDIMAQRSVPHYHSSAMDGIATVAAKTAAASLRNPVVLALDEDFTWVDTGDPLPAGYDAVIMIEDTHELENGDIEITQAAAPWQHIRVVGEDVVTGELVLASGRVLNPYEQAAVLAAGHTRVKVQRKVRAVVIPTGDELVAVGDKDELEPGDILEFNSTLLKGQLEDQGATVKVWPIREDDPAVLEEAISEAVQTADMVLVNAGSSAGRDDYTARVIAKLGTVIAHGIAIRPGTPVILGLVDKTPVLGIPGYPVSAALTCELFALPLVSLLQNQVYYGKPKLKAVLNRRVASPPGREEYLRVQVASVQGNWVAVPGSRGAGNTKSLAESDGYLKVPLGREGLEAGSKVEVMLHRTQQQLRRSLLLAGSHDLSLDILAGQLASDYQYRLTTSRVGSLGGLLALKRGEAHLAGAHLLDVDTGDYNVSYVQKYLRGQEMLLVELVKRQQGLLVAKHNPLNITGLEDIGAMKARYINRQRGAGTRVLLDYQLAKHKLDVADIVGYEREVFSHMAVAQAIASGAADVGLGILAAAKAMNLDFIPVSQEIYHLIIPRANLDLPAINAILDIVNSQGFQQRVISLGGYDCTEAGKQTEVGFNNDR